VLEEEVLEKIERHTGSRPKQNNVLVMNMGSQESGSLGVQNGGCVIPKMFARQGGFTVGDEITVRRVHPDESTTTHTWNITGIVDLNWHLFTARTGMRGRNGAPFGTLAPVFIHDPEFAGENAVAQFAWFNLEAGAEFEEVDAKFKEVLVETRQTGGDPRGARRETQNIGPPAAFFPGGELRVTLHRREEISEGTSERGAMLVGALARLPFYALILLAAGVVAIVQANIQSRENEFAMLRGIGMTRRQLFKLLSGEVALLLLCGIAASVLFGVCVGWVFTAWTRAWMPFGGLPIQLRIPWMQILKGVALALALGMAYAMIPVALFFRQNRKT